MSPATFDWAAFFAALDSRRHARCGDMPWREVAAEAGVSSSTISRLKQGHPLDVRTAVALADWAQTSLDLFVRGGREPVDPVMVAVDYLATSLPPWRAKFLRRVMYAADDAIGDVGNEVWRQLGGGERS